MLAVRRIKSWVTARRLRILSYSVAIVGLIGATLVVSQQVPRVPDVAGVQVVGSLTVTGVAPNNSTARIYYQPVLGAKDYRIYDITASTNVKYAGLVHLTADPACPGDASCSHRFALQADGTLVFPYRVVSVPAAGPMVLDVPATQVEWNSLGDGLAHTLVVEAVDALGPAPQANLYTGPKNGADIGLAPGGMLGSNKGPTADGNTSTNGQGPYTNNPQVIARSRSFVVTPNTAYAAIPSSSAATQPFYDTFANSEAGAIHLVSKTEAADGFGNVGLMTYGMNAGTSKEWSLLYRNADDTNSMPFISGDHFMDMLFDGATPGGGAPSHTLYSSMAMNPRQTVDMSNGKVLHMTMEVDGHQSFGRWMGFNLAPTSDPLQGFQPVNQQINNTDSGVFLEFFDGYCTLDIYTGPISSSDHKPTGTAGGSHGSRVWGIDGSGTARCSLPDMYNPAAFSKNGLGLDDRSRYDFFISQTHAALFQDGRLVVQAEIPASGFPWANNSVNTYFTHWLYHSESELGFMLHTPSTFGNASGMCYPMNSYWFNNPVDGTAASADVCNIAYPAGYGFQFSDERHWDNMGFEVLPVSAVPAGNDFAAYGSSVQPPQPQAPQFVGAVSPSPTATSTLTQPGTATPTPVSTSTPVPASTPVPPTAIPAGGVSAYATIQAESFSSKAPRPQTEPTTDIGGGLDLGYIRSTDWLGYASVNFGSTAATQFVARVASQAAAGVTGLVEVHLDSLTSPAVGSFTISNTGSYQSWVTKTANISPTTGAHTVYLVFTSASTGHFVNINWFDFAH
jgi:hypothetical protein